MNEGKLILNDKSVFEGNYFGFEKNVEGEVVFNTGMSGYAETITDPSYAGQILVFTYPLIGNYGIPNKHKSNFIEQSFESEKIHISGLVVNQHSREFDHWQAKISLNKFLLDNKIPGLYNIDTRDLTKKLSKYGSSIGKILLNSMLPLQKKNFSKIVETVSIKTPFEYSKGKTSIIIVDCGVKNSIIRQFLDKNITIIRVPWNYDFYSIKSDGIIISNGPGDPKECVETIVNIKKVLTGKIPVLGICLGAQLLGLAAGADTYKLKLGHRGHNHPCRLKKSHKAFITSQNHGFALDAKTLTGEWEEWFYNINDGTNEGIIHKTKPFFGVQFHPEGFPGPFETSFIYDDFIKIIG